MSRLFEDSALKKSIMQIVFGVTLVFLQSPTTVLPCYRVDCRTSTLWAHTTSMLSWGSPQGGAISSSCAALIIWCRGWNHSNSCKSKYNAVIWPGYMTWLKTCCTFKTNTCTFTHIQWFYFFHYCAHFLKFTLTLWWQVISPLLEILWQTEDRSVYDGYWGILFIHIHYHILNLKFV